jgi:lysophospholipase L1-like esterase
MTRKINFTFLCCILFYACAAYSQQPSGELGRGAKYVALGSSFAAGPGVPEQSGNCGRSDHNYSNLVASALDLILTDVSCNGATIGNIRHTPQRDMPPQIDAIGPDTALVTVTIGGNDINYTSSTFACSGTAADEHCTASLDQATINTALSRLSDELGAMLDEIKAQAPRATIVLVTYPRIFPVDAVNCSELELSAEDTTYLAGLGQKLEDTFVSVASGRQILIADAYRRAAGHGPCAPLEERWVNGASAAQTGIRYHPTAEGHSEMARLVLDALQEN